MNHSKAAGLLLSVVVLLGSAACSTAVGTMAMGNQLGTSPADRDLHAFTTANNMIEIEESQMAASRATSPAVRDFAQMMVTHHTEHQQRHSALLTNLGSTWEAPLAELPVARTLRDNSADAARALQSRSGNDFDRTYMERQVAMHRYALSAIDTLAPATMGSRIPEVRAFLDETRTTIASHLQTAEERLAALGR